MLGIPSTGVFCGVETLRVQCFQAKTLMLRVNKFAESLFFVLASKTELHGACFVLTLLVVNPFLGMAEAYSTLSYLRRPLPAVFGL